MKKAALILLSLLATPSAFAVSYTCTAANFIADLTFNDGAERRLDRGTLTYNDSRFEVHGRRPFTAIALDERFEYGANSLNFRLVAGTNQFDVSAERKEQDNPFNGAVTISRAQSSDSDNDERTRQGGKRAKKDKGDKRHRRVRGVGETQWAVTCVLK